jgi:prephenate dehydrogenase
MPDAKRKQKPRVSIIGAGRLGTALGVALLQRGYAIESLVARRAQKARHAASLLDANPQVLAAKQLTLLRPADVFLITVPDDQIAGVASQLTGLSSRQQHFTPAARSRQTCLRLCDNVAGIPVLCTR